MSASLAEKAPTALPDAGASGGFPRIDEQAASKTQTGAARQEGMRKLLEWGWGLGVITNQNLILFQSIALVPARQADTFRPTPGRAHAISKTTEADQPADAATQS